MLLEDFRALNDRMDQSEEFHNLGCYLVVTGPYLAIHDQGFNIKTAVPGSKYSYQSLIGDIRD